MPSDQRVPPELHELEAEIMDHVWRLGEARVRAVLEALNASAKRQRAYTTVMTTMVKLEKKGLLERRREGRTDVYRPLLSHDDYMAVRARADLDVMLDRYGEVGLVALAREMESLDPERRERLRRLARRD